MDTLHPKETERVRVEEWTGLPGGPVSENLPASAGDTSLIPGPGRAHLRQGPQARHNYWARAPQQEKPPQWETQHRHKDPAQPTINELTKFV